MNISNVSDTVLHLQCNIAGVECLAIRISYTGERGWEIYMPLNEMKPVYESLLNEGTLSICYFSYLTNLLIHTLTLYRLCVLYIFPILVGKEYNIGHFGTFVVNVLRMEKGKSCL